MTQTPATDHDRDTQADEKTFWMTNRIVWLILFGFWLLDSLSIQTELDRTGQDYPRFLPWVQEGSSVLVILLLVPLLIRLGLHFPLQAGRWLSSLPAHMLGFLAFAGVHITAMILLRELIWAYGYGADYNFFGAGSVVQNIVYEMRKDLATYATIQFLIMLLRDHSLMRLEIDAAREDARRSKRLTLKSGGRIIHVEAQAFRYAKAAANYVEIEIETGTHLARMTLSELARQLSEAGIDAVRVHRSWLVNRACIEQIKPTGQGDLVLTLKDGQTLPGSRRYRASLGA